MGITLFVEDPYKIKAFAELEVENQREVFDDKALTIDRVLEMYEATVKNSDVEVEIYAIEVIDKKEFLKWITEMMKIGKIKVTRIDIPKRRRTIQIEEIEINGVKYSFEEIMNIVEGLLKMGFPIRYVVAPNGKEYPIMFAVKREENNMEKTVKYFGMVLAPRVD